MRCPNCGFRVQNCQCVPFEEVARKEVLYEICRRFVQDNQITCKERIYPCVDWKREDIYELIENICDMVGYYDEA